MKNTYIDQTDIKRILRFLLSFEGFTVDLYDPVRVKFSGIQYFVASYFTGKTNIIELGFKRSLDRTWSDFTLVLDMNEETYSLLYRKGLVEKGLLNIENCTMLESHLLVQDLLFGPANWYVLEKRLFLKGI